MVDDQGRTVKYNPTGSGDEPLVIDLGFSSTTSLNTVDFDVTLSQGEYTIFKSLKIREGQAKVYADDFFDFLMSKANSTDNGTPCLAWNPKNDVAEPCDDDCQTRCENIYIYTDALGNKNVLR